jgi:hypothetical protein
LEEIYSFLTSGVDRALEVIAPVKSMNVRKGIDLYLKDTLRMMARYIEVIKKVLPSCVCV